MGQITLEQVGTALAWFVGVGGSLGAIIVFIRKMLKAFFKEQLETMNHRFDRVEARLDEVDRESTKNFIVSILAQLDSGLEIDEVQRQRFYEQFEHYLKAGGNGYIQARVNELKAAGKL